MGENEEAEEKTGEHDAPSAELKEAIAKDDNLKVDKKVELDDVDENSPKVVDDTASEVVESTSPSKSPAAPDSSNEKEDEDEQDKPLDGGDKNQNATKEEMKIHSEKDTNDETQNEVSEIVECTQSKKNEGELLASNIENGVSNTLDAERSASDAHEEQVVEVPVKEEFQNDNKGDVSISESSSKPQELESPEESQDAKEEIKSHLTKEEEQSKDDEDNTSSKDEKESSEKGISPVPSAKEKDQASDEAKFDNESEADEKIETQDVTADENDQEKSDDLIEDKTNSGILATEISSDEKITADAQVEKHAEVLAQASEDASDKDSEKTTPSKEVEGEPLEAEKTIDEINQKVSDIEKDLDAINEKMFDIEKNLDDANETASKNNKDMNELIISPTKETRQGAEEKDLAQEKQDNIPDKISGIFASDTESRDGDDSAGEEGTKDAIEDDEAPKSSDDVDTVDGAAKDLWGQHGARCRRC